MGLVLEAALIRSQGRSERECGTAQNYRLGRLLEAKYEEARQRRRWWWFDAPKSCDSSSFHTRRWRGWQWCQAVAADKVGHPMAGRGAIM